MKPITLAIACAIAGCVSNGTYNKKVAELNKLREQDAAGAQERERAQDDRIKDLEKASLELQNKLIDTQAALDKANSDRTALQKKLDDGTQLVTTMKDRLEKLGQNVDGLVKERSQLAQAMADTNARLEELRKQKAAADARAAQYRAVVARLRSMIDSHQLQVAIRGGRMIIALPNDVLFESGRTDVKSDGKAALAKVALALAPIADRSFLIAGHTDNVPIRTELFPSNWELSTRRAVEVVHYLVSQGMNPKLLAAAGYGEFDPVAPNDTPEHRAQNRRIEIVLQPNLSDLPPLDDAVAK